MYQPIEFNPTNQTSRLSFRKSPVSSSGDTKGSMERWLVVTDSKQKEAQCLKFARRFTNNSEAEIHVMKPASADLATEVRRTALAIQADWLCMVTDGGPGLMKLFLRRVDESIVRTAPCPVVNIPEALRSGSEVESDECNHSPVNRILVPISRSLLRRDVVQQAVVVAERFGAKIDLLGVEEILQLPFDSGRRNLRSERRAQKRAIKAALAALAEEAIPKRLRGRKSASLELPLFYATLSAARKLKSDLIVLGVPTRRWLADRRIDGGTERILRGAECPVICFPETDASCGTALHHDRRLGRTMSAYARARHARIDCPTTITKNRNIYDYDTENSFN